MAETVTKCSVKFAANTSAAKCLPNWRTGSGSGNLIPMRHLFRIVFVWSVALAFVASGSAWRHCMAAQQPVPVAVQVQDHGAQNHGAHDQASHDQASHDHASHSHPSHSHPSHSLGSQHHAAADQTADDNGKPASNNHECGKCCSICTISGAMPPAPSMTAFEAHAVAFTLQRDVFTGTSSPVDPGIPKLIA
ncbi:hypothetical protein [Leptospira sp. severe_002]|uniref:hypothetical protein n=1 Tax=Leptospira sp. severe_002 TaxID=2838237 RepID=UPI001E448458|nr:hypothetical protein [Leptospira sp. severe_002]